MRSSSWLERAVVLATAVAYVLTASRNVLGGDSGEFATLFETGGVAHPPGYPLYVLALRAFHFVPHTTPAHGAALVTAGFGVLSVYLLQRAARAWGASPHAAAIVSCVYAFSPIAWRLATQAEVFTLNATIAAAIVLVAAPSPGSGTPSPGSGAPSPTMSDTQRIALLGLLAGLGLSNHHSIVLVAPIGLWGVRTYLRAPRPIARLASGALGIVVGLVPYAYSFERARNADPQSTWIWGDAGTAAGLFAHVRRAQYGTTRLSITPASGRGAADPLEHVLEFLWRLTNDLAGLPVLALVALSVAYVVRKERLGSTARSAWTALSATIVLAGPAFVALFNIPLDAIGVVIVERFYLLPELLVCVAAAPAIDASAKILVKRTSLAVAVTVLAGAGRGFTSFAEVRAEHQATLETYATDTLRSLPPNAVLLADGDAYVGAYRYVRLARGIRSDVTFISPTLLLTEWHHRQSSDALGIALERPIEHSLNLRALLAQLQSTGRPVFVTEFFASGLDRGFPWFPFGTTLRVLPRGATLPSPREVEDINIALFRNFTFADRYPPNPWTARALHSYIRPWALLAEAYSAAGFEEDAARCQKRAAALATTFDLAPVMRSKVP